MLARPLVHNAPFPAEFSGLYLDGSFAATTYIGATYDDSAIIAGGSGTYGNERIIGTAPTGLAAVLPTAEELAIQGDVSAPAGTFSFIIAVDDTVNHWTTFQPVTITVYEALTITGTFTNTGTVGVPYSSAITISGGLAPYSNPVVASGAAPDDLTLSIDGDQLILSGTQTISDIYDFTVSCDSGDGQTATSGAQSVDFT